VKITVDEVRQVAMLARLGLSEAEAAKLAGELDTILAYVEQLRELDTSTVEGTSHAVPISCPTREDTRRPSGIADRLIEGAPEREDRFILVPKIIE
jgi:aspartyl-tRNA(Asn)/glutamyl-tRNA(Gln) amidotransferase subunit C